jgi:hypothetical protein
MTVTDLRDYPTPEQMADICGCTIRLLRELKPDIEHLGRHTVDLWRWCEANGYPDFYHLFNEMAGGLELLNAGADIVADIAEAIPDSRPNHD